MSTSFYLVAGLGKTGFSMASYLKRHDIDFALYDTREEPANLEQFKTHFPAAKIFLKEVPSELFQHLTAILISPGISWDSDLFNKAFYHMIPVYGDIEFFAQRVKTPVIAVTGTNGKTTVVSLLGEMAMVQGLKVAVGGNIGTAVLDLLDDGQDYDLYVLELSSFQLEFTHSLRMVAACILNLSADHIDRHQNFDAYKAAKQRIYFGAHHHIYNREDANTKPLLDTKSVIMKSKAISFGFDAPEYNYEWGLIEKGGKTVLVHGQRVLMPVDDLNLVGKHNWLNALAACAMAKTVNIDYKAMIDALKHFQGLRHRCQKVLSRKGITWINDSKGTNVGATISAIESIGSLIEGKIILIAGGMGKGADFTELRPVVGRYVKALLLIGQDAGKIEEALGDLLPVSRCKDLKAVIAKASSLAKSGDSVLFSPACASQDMFKDFNERGDIFMQLVNEQIS